MMKGTQAAVEAMFIFQQHDNIQTVEVINLFLRPVVTYSGYAECVDVWNRIDWAGGRVVEILVFSIFRTSTEHYATAETWKN